MEEAQGVTQIVDRMVVIKGRCMILLAEFLVLPVGDDRQVAIAGRGTAQQMLQENLPGGGIQQVRTAYCMSDALLGVVNDDRQLIGVQAILAFDDKIRRVTA